ncbi:ABC transporter [Bifidobacterium avesanii]|nr:ABC transporter [Bifidobacterium avesanii]
MFGKGGNGKSDGRRGPVLGRQMTALVAVACLLAGMGGTAVVLAPHPPQVLAPANTNATMPIETQQVNDGRSVTINAEEIAMAPVVAPRSGMVTASNCKPGASLASGQSIMSIDGKGALMLATAEPLWRPLKVGDKGPDAEGLNNALKAIGAGDVDGDTVTEATIDAFVAAAAKAGITLAKDYAVIDTADVAWLPSDGVTVSACPAPVGQIVGQGQSIAELPAMAASAKAQSLPTGAVAGERVIQAGDVTLDITDQGDVIDLVSFSRSSAFRTAATAMQSNVRQVNVQWVLKNPVAVGVVPASAIGVVGGTAAGGTASGGAQACIVVTGGTGGGNAAADTAGDRAVNVNIVGSMLGRTYIQGTDGSIPSGSVRLTPNAGGCS